MIVSEDILFDPEPHAYSVGGQIYTSVTQVIRAAGLGEDFSMVSTNVMEAAQQRGRLVHLACQYIDEGKLDLSSVHESILGYVEAYMLFRKECKIQVIATEERLAAILPALPLSRYLAGCPDLVCFIHGVRAVVDRKTSSAMGKSMGLQTAGYEILWNYIHPKQLIYERFGLKLNQNGKYKLIPHLDPEDKIAFWDALYRGDQAEVMDPWRRKYA